ncbi:hypothetical protein, partial [Idiomarina abyssalis]|uniref:hypothetical protein n=1 Tax=Idiomarina abyssalis TaxID=86102 RepID=UPI001F3FD169
TNISVCLLLQVPTQFAWLDSIVKERCFFRSREAYSTLPSRFVNHFLAAFFSARLKQTPLPESLPDNS